VCPTGIDIRNGLQNECIGCAACIDACDQVMDKMDLSARPDPLLHGERRQPAPHPDGHRAPGLPPAGDHLRGDPGRLAAATAWSLSMRIPLKVNVLKDRGTLSREADDGSIENIYRLQIMNTGDKTRTFRIGIAGLERHPPPRRQADHGGRRRDRHQYRHCQADPGAAKSGASPISFSVEDVADAAVAVSEQSKFWMP